MSQAPSTPAPARPAATVILLRDGRAGLQTLLLRRNAQLAFHGGSWVFPGGRVDPQDYPPDAPDDVEAAALGAAVREAKEESGLDIDRDSLVYFSHWTTPIGLPKRFSTWFYLAPAPAAEVEVDGDEIHDHRWMGAGEALTAQRQAQLELPAPTFVSLLALEPYRDVASALAAFSERAPEIFVPRNQAIEGGRLSLYQEDAGYDEERIDAPGSRHRLWMVETRWRYERSD